MNDELAITGDVVPMGQLTLFDLAAIANREHRAAMHAGIAMVRHAAASGEALIAAKAQVRHGEWLTWLAANFEASVKTAERFMLIAANSSRVTNLEEPSLRKALEAISDGPLKAPRPTIDPPAAPDGEFQIIYADPPWRYEIPGGQTPQARAVERHYPTMTDEAIAALDVPAAAESVCFMWATNPKLREALEVLEAWGFEYRTNLAWVKDRIGMGYYVRGQHELLLIGRRGEFPVPHESRRPSSVLSEPRGQHSAKPNRAYDLIEAMWPTASRIELFARQDRPGWARWGAEATT